MKLELKHLAPYLPYGLKIISETNRGYNVNAELSGLSIRKYSTNPTALMCSFRCDLFSESYSVKRIKPILRPLSDLTKEIKKLRKLFYKTTESKDGSASFTRTLIYDDGFKIKVEDYYYTGDNVSIYHEDISDFEIYQKLFEWHYDVFGLIDKGLAIDINSLEKP